MKLLIKAAIAGAFVLACAFIARPAQAGTCLYAPPGFLYGANTCKAPFSMRMGIGNNQLLPIDPNPDSGRAINFSPLSVIVTDSGGNAAQNVPVHFRCAGSGYDPNNCRLGGTQIIFYGQNKGMSPGGDFTNFTDQTGTATDQLILLYGAAAFQVIAEKGLDQGPLLPPVTFNLAGEPDRLTVVSGGNQTKSNFLKPAQFDPISVRLATPGGAPVPNAIITFKCSPAGVGCRLNPASPPDSISVSTDAQGIATLNRMPGNVSVVTPADSPVQSQLLVWYSSTTNMVVGIRTGGR